MGIFLNIDRSRIKRLNEFEDENGNNTTEEIEDDYEEGEGNETNAEEDTGTTDTQTDTDAQDGETDDNAGKGEDTENNEDTEGEDDGIEMAVIQKTKRIIRKQKKTQMKIIQKETMTSIV